MNFLGHFFLNPPENSQILVGNFLGDFIKGKIEQHNFPSGLQQGIVLHRILDNYTDSHSLILATKQLFSKKYRRYAGIILDMSLDHFLAKYWQEYHHLTLTEFSGSVYTILKENTKFMPKKAIDAAASMRQYNWLCSYTELENLDVALNNIGLRLKHDNPLDSAIDEVERLYSPIKDTFRQFIVEITQHIKAVNLGTL